MDSQLVTQDFRRKAEDSWQDPASSIFRVEKKISDGGSELGTASQNESEQIADGRFDEHAASESAAEVDRLLSTVVDWWQGGIENL